MVTFLHHNPIVSIYLSFPHPTPPPKKEQEDSYDMQYKNGIVGNSDFSIWHIWAFPNFKISPHLPKLIKSFKFYDKTMITNSKIAFLIIF